VELPEASMAQRSPDRALTANLNSIPEPSELPAELDAALTADTLADAPLATSLPLVEVVHPTEIAVPPVEISLVHSHNGATEATSEEQTHPSHNVLAEIAELDSSESMDTMTQLTQYLDHPDHIMRAALASVLGELAIKRRGQNIELIMTMLNTLTTDPNLQVKTEAMAAIGRIGTELNILPSTAG
jgi:hypothetical protein